MQQSIDSEGAISRALRCLASGVAVMLLTCCERAGEPASGEDVQPSTNMLPESSLVVLPERCHAAVSVSVEAPSGRPVANWCASTSESGLFLCDVRLPADGTPLVVRAELPSGRVERFLCTVGNQGALLDASEETPLEGGRSILGDRISGHPESWFVVDAEKVDESASSVVAVLTGIASFPRQAKMVRLGDGRWACRAAVSRLQSEVPILKIIVNTGGQTRILPGGLATRLVR